MTAQDRAKAETTPDDAGATEGLPAYDEVIVSQGIQIPFVPGIVTPRIEKPLRKSRYEKGEAKALRRILQKGDRVLELGAGLGLLSAIAAQTPGVEAVTAVEANPSLMPMIRETHRLNGVTSVEVLNAVVTGPGVAGEGPLPFYLRRDFWASSMEPNSRRYKSVVQVQQMPFEELLAERRPSVIVCDIEGGELDLFAGADLSGVRAVVVEVHPKVYGDTGRARVERALEAAGLARQPGFEKSTVQLFLRLPGSEPAAAAWLPDSPRVLVPTCMKDEGPFILEWIAWHRAIGVTDFVVYTNHCSDGTDRILDRLDAMGIVTHLENPAIAAGSTRYQPEALEHVTTLPVFEEADFVISMDVDEFINVRVGKGRLRDLFIAAGQFDVLSMFEMNHGANGKQQYERGWVKDLFPKHQSDRPGKRKAIRGVKSIVHRGPAIGQIRNHRPDLALPLEEAVWLDGSGRPLTTLAEDRELNGADCRGGYNLVSLDHYPLRSLASYLVKMFRGDVVIEGKQVSQRYWRTRNDNYMLSSTFGRADVAARAEYARLMQDAELARLHEEACAAHEARIAELLGLPEYQERIAWIMDEAW
jgi:FkbM family methyltransferase